MNCATWNSRLFWPGKNTGTTDASLRRIILPVNGDQACSSARPNGVCDVATRPAGNKITAPPAFRCCINSLRTATFRLMKSKSCGYATGTMFSRTSGGIPLNALVRTFRSDRLCDTRHARASPSTNPKGWFATMTTGPVAGIISTSARDVAISISRKFSRRSHSVPSLARVVRRNLRASQSSRSFPVKNSMVRIIRVCPGPETRQGKCHIFGVEMLKNWIVRPNMPRRAGRCRPNKPDDIYQTCAIPSAAHRVASAFQRWGCKKCLNFRQRPRKFMSRGTVNSSKFRYG